LAKLGLAISHDSADADALAEGSPRRYFCIECCTVRAIFRHITQQYQSLPNVSRIGMQRAVAASLTRPWS